MPGLTHLTGEAVAALAVAGGVYVIAATALTCRFLARKAGPVEAPPAISLIKPLHGTYPGMDAVLEAYCDQRYPAPVQIVFGVQDSADPAIAVIEALKARRPQADIELVIDDASHGVNRKISNVINITKRARHEVLVMSDADIAVTPDYLSQVAGALAAPGVGAVTCLYEGRDDGRLWGALAAMGISYGFLANAVLGRALGLAEPCFGSTIALTRQTLRAIGGFEAFADHLADDYEIGRAARDLGLSIAVPPMTVAHLCLEANLTELTHHELRWGRTVRQIDPAGYAGSVITNPLPLAVIAAALLGFSQAAIGLILAILVVRIACKFAMDAATGARAGRWWMIPARDALSFGVFVASFAVNTVGWQGQRFRVGRDGVLSHP